MRRALSDPDIRQSLLLALLLMAASGGLAYLYYLGRVLRIAWTTPCEGQSDCALVFGRALEADGSVGDDFAQRLDRAHALARDHGVRRVVLMGGSTGPGLSEAAAGHAHLLSRGLPEHVEILLEDRSLDTLENLRNARELLGRAGLEQDVLLVSSRSHLARCRLLAAQLGFRHRLCAAEPRLHLSTRNLARLGLEAGYLSWLSLGLIAARITGNRRLIERLR